MILPFIMFQAMNMVKLPHHENNQDGRSNNAQGHSHQDGSNNGDEQARPQLNN